VVESRKGSECVLGDEQSPELELLFAPWLWIYLPVNIDERDGQHTGVVTNAFANVVPYYCA
jgi:hypothetical protein